RRTLMVAGQWKESGQPTEELHDHIQKLIDTQAKELVLAHTGEGHPEDWNLEEIAEAVHAWNAAPVATIREQLDSARETTLRDGPEAAEAAIQKQVTELLLERLKQREQEMGSETLKNLERAASIRAIDTFWMEHLDTMDYLRTGIGLRGYGQRDPLVEYQKEGYALFKKLLVDIKQSIVDVVFRAEAVRQERNEGVAIHPTTAPPKPGGQQSAPVPSGDSTSASSPLANPYKNVGRNDPCPCGATKADGTPKKFKHCHGKNE
ncbi:MAG: hypothetical protein WD972_03320, partial [Candidatus Andersenbacteria bacterium]